jgi:oleandomycin transport system ATP-binding protein
VVAEAGQVRQLIALTGQYASVDEELTGAENMIMIGRLLNFSRPAARQRADELLGRFGLADAAGRAVKTYSGGMRRRLDLAASLVGDPEVIFLDEPTTGLDPRARSEVWETIREFVARGVTVLLTTQYLDEADELADVIAVMDHGRVVAAGTSAELKATTGSRTLVARAANPSDTPELARVVAAVTGSTPRMSSETGLVTAAARDNFVMATVVRWLDDLGLAASELALRLPSLDEVFLTLTEHGAGDGDASAGNQWVA